MEDGRQQEDSRNNTVILKHLNELQMALHDLIPDTTFTFTVVAFTRNGPGEKAVIRSKTHIDCMQSIEASVLRLITYLLLKGRYGLRCHFPKANFDVQCQVFKWNLFNHPIAMGP